MKKFNLILSAVVFVASSLLASCAQPNVPTPVAAPPMYVEATYTAQKKGGHLWKWNSVYSWTKATFWRGLYQHDDDKAKSPAHLRYEMKPNTDWSAAITEGAEYIQFRVGQNDYAGFDDSKYDLTSITSGKRGLNTLRFFVVKTPAFGEEAITCKVEITMDGQTVDICKFFIQAPLVQESTPEEPEEEEGGAA